MQIDYDYVRDLLLELEKQCDGMKIFYFGEDTGPTQIRRTYHLRYMIRAGLVEGSDDYYSDLTPQGHQVAEIIRNDSSWKRIKPSFVFIGKETISAFIAHWMSVFF